MLRTATIAAQVVEELPRRELKGNESNVIAIEHTDFVNVLLLKVGGSNMIEDF